MELQQQLSEARKRVTEIEAFSEKMKGDLADSEVKFSSERKKLESGISNLIVQRDMLQQQLKETRIDLKKRLDDIQGLQKIVSDSEVDKENLGNNVKKLQNTLARFVIYAGVEARNFQLAFWIFKLFSETGNFQLVF